MATLAAVRHWPFTALSLPFTAVLLQVAGVPAAALAHANASGPKPLDSHDLSALLFSEAGSCGADRSKSPRTSLMYFYGDDENGECFVHEYMLARTAVWTVVQHDGPDHLEPRLNQEPIQAATISS